MKPLSILFVVFSTVFTHLSAQTILGKGKQPQVAIDSKGIVRVIYGHEDKIYYSVSKDHGVKFSKPALIGEVKNMHLGMSRGPQLASSADYSVVTAIDKNGNIHSFISDHKTGSWHKMKQVNDIEASAPEGLIGITADGNNNFYAVWLDIRDDKKNNICFATLNGNTTWSKNRIIYKSPDTHVCECCKPSVAAKDNVVAVMFRNWIDGSRDLYLATSSDKGQTFDAGQKLGTGTWKLDACPMDGGGLSIDADDQIHTVWQREGSVYYAIPGESEVLITEGRNCSITDDVMAWSKGTSLVIKRKNLEPLPIGEGSALKFGQFSSDQALLAVWEKDDKVVFEKIFNLLPRLRK